MQRGAAADAEQHIFAPKVYKNDERNRNQLRQPMRINLDGDIFQTIDDKQPHHDRRKYTAELGNNLRRLLAFRKEHKRGKTRRHCAKRNRKHRQDDLHRG